MFFTVVGLKELHVSVRIHLVQNTELLSHPGILFLASLLTLKRP